MRMPVVIGLLLYVVSLSAQQPDYPVRGSFTSVPFGEFVQKAEQQTGLHFFYKPEWMPGITVTAAGDSGSLRKILTDCLLRTDLFFYMDTCKNVIITKGAGINTYLPELMEASGVAEGNGYVGRNGYIAEIEKSYIEGRRETEIKTIVIGNPAEQKPGKKIAVRGRLLDKESGEPLIGATVFVRETGSGYATDGDGQFLMTLPAGTYEVSFRYLGMQEVQYFLSLKSDGPLIVEMNRKLIPLDEVILVADRLQHVKGTQMGYEHITLKTIKEIPVVLGERDVLKVAQMLPGVQTMGEGTAGFNVRGSAADQNMFFINKIPVYNTSHMLGFFSAFNPDMIKDFTLYKSNIPAKYGGRLSSIFILTSPRGNNKKITARGGISPVTGHIMIEGPLKKEKHSFVVSARSTYSDWLLSRVKNADIRNSNVAFYDLAGQLNLEPNSRNSLRIFSYYSHDKFSLATTNHYKYDNAGASADWKHQWRSDLNSEMALVAARYSFETVDSNSSISAYKHAYSIGHYEFRTDFVWIPRQEHLVTFGLNGILYSLNRGDVLPAGPLSTRSAVHLGTEKGIESALYLADEYKVFSYLTLALGLRYSFYFMPGTDGNNPAKFYSGPELRGSLNFRTGENSSVKLSYNKTRQYLFMLSNTIAVSPSDQWKLCDYHLRPPHTDQFSLGFYRDFVKRDVSFSSEVYYKNTQDIIEYKDGASFISELPIETQLLQGGLKAYGLELMLRKNTGRLSGWLSYSYSSSTVHVDGPNSWDKINFGIAYPSNYDRPHAVNTVLNYRFSRQLSIGSNVVYNTGRPYTAPVAIYYVNGRQQIYYSMRNEYRIPDYFRVDLSVNIEGNLRSRKLAHSSWMLNVYNLTGRKNAYSVFFKAEGYQIKSYKMSIFAMPVFTLTWNFKLGNYASD